MSNVLGKILSFLIALIIMFLVPIRYYSIKQDNIIQTEVECCTSDLMELVSSHGYITRNMYENYLKQLGETKKIYKLDLNHESYQYEPEYRLRSDAEVIDDDESGWTGVNEYHNLPVITELPEITDPITHDGHLNTETNESIFAKAVRTPPSLAHVHTSACYAGHIHSTSYVTPEGKTINCFAPNLRIRYESRYTDGIMGDLTFYLEIYCGRCGALQYNISYTQPNSGSRKSYIKVNGSVVYNDQAGWTQAYQDLDKFRMFIYSYFPRERIQDSVYEVKPKEGEMIYRLPIVGEYKGCGACNDYKIFDFWNNNSSPNRHIIITCLHCCKKVVDVSFGKDSNGNTYASLFTIDSKGVYTYVGSTLTNNDIKSFVKDLDNIRASDANSPYRDPSWYNNWSCGYWSDYYYNESTVHVPVNWKGFNYSFVYNMIHHDCNFGNFTYCSNKGELYCDELISSLVPTNPVQAVYVGEPLITTAIATYVDGSTNVVLCSTNFNTTEIVKNKDVELTYKTTIGGKEYIYKTHITVTVIPRSTKCIHGHTYNLNNDGTDPGCPYCRGWLRDLSVASPASGKLTIYRNPESTLEIEGVILLAVYLDGHTEYVTSGYVDNLDPCYVGTQTVTIGYKGLTTTLDVEVLRNRKLCLICHRYYNLFPDDTDPGCPYCRARVPVFTGNIMTYSTNITNNDILEELYEGSGIYYFQQGDNFSITVSSKEKQGLFSTVLFSNLPIRVIKSGIILN